MKDNAEAKAGPLRKRDEPVTEIYGPGPEPGARAPGPQANPNGHPAGSKIDGWTIIDVLLHRWHWLVLGGMICSGLFYLLGLYAIKPKFTASAQLIRYETPMSDYFKTAPMSAETFSGIIRSPEVLRRVGEQLIPPLSPEQLSKCIKIDPVPDSDIINVLLAARAPRQAVDWLNRYTRETVKYTKEFQKAQISQLANDYLKHQVKDLDQHINALQQEFLKLPVSPLVTNKLTEIGGQLSALSNNLAGAQSPVVIAKQRERLQLAMDELNDLLSKYTELHPMVKAKEEEIANLRNRIVAAAGSTNLASAAAALTVPLTHGGDMFNPQLDIVRMKLMAMEDGRIDLAKREKEAELYASNPPGFVRVLAPATDKTVKDNFRLFKIVFVAIFGGLLGMGASVGLVLLVEFADNRLKTAEDVQRVTRLPVLTSLGDLSCMAPEARSHWAFRTWTMLQGRLSRSANHGLVCGITSSAHGEGRSTWIGLLAEAASLTGYRVLTIATRPSPSHVEDDPDSNPEAPPAEETQMNNANCRSSALTTSVLSSPAQVTDQLTGPNSQPMVHIPLPGWVWNLERRKQWREALNHWRQIDNLVILVELPPAGVPEAVLLGSNLPNIVWLTDSGTAEAAETRTQLETLRYARCNLVGAVLNRQTATPVKKRFSRWLSCMALATSLAGTLSTASLTSQAQETTPPATPAVPAAEEDAAPATNRSFSIVRPSQRAAWQQRLTLGPGDLLTLNLYGQPDLARAEVAVGPDGRISYLEAQDIQAAGLTVDELRTKLDQALGQYRRAPRTLVTPVAFRSKRYYMLGKVATKGVYVLDRPLTVLEALARAHGLETGLVERNMVDLVDFQRSFIARGGKRIPINLDQLFQQGDLSQNIAVEPGDYIYFAPGDIQQVYVVGEVRLPGATPYTPDMTVIAAITARGGYTARAFKMRVLVIRGSLNKPQAIAVDTHAILDGATNNFKLQPKDVIYVNSRPFIRVEELADVAATAFIQSVIANWTGVDVITPF